VTSGTVCGGANNASSQVARTSGESFRKNGGFRKGYGQEAGCQDKSQGGQVRWPCCKCEAVASLYEFIGYCGIARRIDGLTRTQTRRLASRTQTPTRQLWLTRTRHRGSQTRTQKRRFGRRTSTRTPRRSDADTPLRAKSESDSTTWWVVSVSSSVPQEESHLPSAPQSYSARSERGVGGGAAGVGGGVGC